MCLHTVGAVRCCNKFLPALSWHVVEAELDCTQHISITANTQMLYDICCRAQPCLPLRCSLTTQGNPAHPRVFAIFIWFRCTLYSKVLRHVYIETAWCLSCCWCQHLILVCRQCYSICGTCCTKSSSAKPLPDLICFTKWEQSDLSDVPADVCQQHSECDNACMCGVDSVCMMYNHAGTNE